MENYETGLLNDITACAELRGEWIKCEDDTNWEYIYYGRDVIMYFETVAGALAYLGQQVPKGTI